MQRRKQPFIDGLIAGWLIGYFIGLPILLLCWFVWHSSDFANPFLYFVVICVTLCAGLSFARSIVDDLRKAYPRK